MYKKNRKAEKIIKTIEKKDVSYEIKELLIDNEDWDTFFCSWIRFKSQEEIDSFLNYIKIINPNFYHVAFTLNKKERFSVNKWLLVKMMDYENSDGFQGFYNHNFEILTKKDILYTIEKKKEAILDTAKKIKNDLQKIKG